jgi:PAS domain S-box-containing protein
VATNQYNRQLLSDTQEASEMLKAQESMLRQNTYELSQAKETAEKKLATEQVNSKRYKAIIQNTDISIFFLDEKGSIQYANKAAAQMTGFTSKKLLGENIKNLIPSYFSLYYQQFTENPVEADTSTDLMVELITANKTKLSLYYQLAEIELDKEVFAILYLNKP